MARAQGLLPSALRAARAGLTATEWYKLLRVQGVAPRKAEAYRLYKFAVGMVSSHANEIGAPQGQKPRIAELEPYPTVKATGVMQTVSLVYRNRTTGAFETVFYRVTSKTGVTRNKAKKMAIEAYAGQADRYNQDLIGAVHSSAYRMEPSGF